MVDYRVLQNRRGHVDMLTDLMNGELQSKDPSDVVLFLGPPARYWDKVPEEALEKADGSRPQFFYFQYRPYLPAHRDISGRDHAGAAQAAGEDDADSFTQRVRESYPSRWSGRRPSARPPKMIYNETV